ncbi:hypothetical protein P5673_028536 [Acropora cervicornis]|uniref:Uncharacterized protein n=1 Tax=Acropora cervicornis TaxID=6130 RepID=A0AAD9PX36_ACRCE|nr:hypothetical protein P5673_028536 [Acropora cervicornis]
MLTLHMPARSDEKEAATQSQLKKLKTETKASSFFNFKGNKVQYEFDSSLLEVIDGVVDKISRGNLSAVNSELERVKSLIAKRYKLVRFADKSPAGWTAIEEYESDELADDSEDKKKVRRCAFASKVAHLRDPELRKLAEGLPLRTAKAKAPSATERCSRAFQKFREWSACFEEFVCLSSDELSVAFYLEFLQQQSFQYSALESACYGINWAHNLYGFSSPCDSKLVRNVLEAAKRELTKPVVKREPVTPAMISSIRNSWRSTESRNSSFVPSSPLTPASSSTFSPLTPANEFISTNRHLSTKKLHETQLKRRSRQSSGRKFASRPLGQCVKEQNKKLKQIAQDVHHGFKENLLAGIAHSVSISSSKQNSSSSGSEWDGQLSVQDIVELTKMIHDHKAGKSIYDTLTVDIASNIHHISSFEVVKMQDSISQKETFRSLREHLPGFNASERRIEQLKCKWHKEFEVVLQPSRTKTGWYIDPERLRECILFAYPWLREVDTEWRRLYGDARSFGGQKSVLFSLSIINNEAMFHDCSFQSPEENCWPIHIFYGPDSRLNLELNT